MPRPWFGEYLARRRRPSEWLAGQRRVSERLISERLTRRSCISERWSAGDRGYDRGYDRDSRRRCIGGGRSIEHNDAQRRDAEDETGEKPNRAEPVRERGADQNRCGQRERGGEAQKAVVRRDDDDTDKTKVPVLEFRDRRRGKRFLVVAQSCRCGTTVASTEHCIFANQLGILLAQL